MWRHSTHLLIAVGLASASCAPTATFHRTDGPPIEGTIVDSDATSLTLEVPDRVPHGRLIALRKTQVTIAREALFDVDHPGNVIAALSVLPIGASVYLLSAGAEGLSRGGVSGELAGGLLTGMGAGSAIAGVAMLSGGLWAWGVSRHDTAIYLAPGGVSGRF